MFGRSNAGKRGLRGRQSKSPRPSPRASPRLPRRASPRLNPGRSPRPTAHGYARAKTRVNAKSCVSPSRETMDTRTNSTVSKRSSKSSVSRIPVRQPNFLTVNDEYDGVNAGGNSSIEIREASDFISEFDAAMCRLEKLEQAKDKRKPSRLSMGSQKDDKFNLEECLMKAKLNKKQKQALLIMILCFDAEFPATVFEKLCKSHTMKVICDEIFNDKSIGILTEIA